MHRKFIALIIAGAVAIGSLNAAPAHADSNDARRIFAGLAALALLGAALNHDRDDHVVTQQPRYTPPHQPRYQPRRHTQPKGLNQQFSRYDLPRECLSNFTVNRATKRLFGARCLQNKYRHARSLPQACEYQFRTNGVVRTTYEPVCLRERGYRLSRK